MRTRKYAQTSVAAFASMVIINGIITFMLTSGHWVDNHQFWIGFFNPTYFPSLAFRFVISLALAGIYALITASVQKDSTLKAQIVRWAALWIVPSLMVLPALGWWYIRKIPAEVWASAHGAMPTGTHFAVLAGSLLAVTFALVLLTLLRPARLHVAFSLVVAIVALGTMGSFEFVREAIRKPYVIGNYLYANSVYATPIPGDGGFNVEKINEVGVLKSAKWLQDRELTTENQLAVGREVFRVECESCHTTDSYRGIKKYIALRQWDQKRLEAMLASIDMMHNNVMPPFAGTDSERAALANFLGPLAPLVSSGSTDGKTVFERNCSMCHRLRSDDALFARLPRNAQDASNALKDLPNLFARMPDLKLSDQEQSALVDWVNQQRAGHTSAVATQGGN